MSLIANFGAGTDHIDLEEAKSKNIIVTNTPGLLADDTADLIMSLLLALPRRLYEGSKLVAEGNWNGWSPTKMLGKKNQWNKTRNYWNGKNRTGCGKKS